jgi:hypothetical protein
MALASSSAAAAGRARRVMAVRFSMNGLLLHQRATASFLA